MDAQVCISCLNKKPINETTNRLVTERCGHVKCIDCLVHEKAGCAACAVRAVAKAKVEHSKGPFLDSTVETDFPLEHFLVISDVRSASKTAYCNDKKKKKPETSHIKLESDENGRSYFCTVCKKKFHSRSQVVYHAYCNGQRKPYQCPECNKSFATHSHYKYHMRVHRNERTYACDLCGESFFQMSKLQRHKLKHTKEKKYTCAECNKAFNNLSALRKHGLLHSGARPHQCPQCGACFRDSSNFKRHVAKHISAACGGRGPRARAHRCPRCPQAFHARKDLRRHAAVHDDSKPFRCKVCSRRFRRKDNLERHIRNTHPPRSASPANNTTTTETNNPELIEKDVDENTTEDEKSKIIEANNARQSVIFGPVKREVRPPSPEANEYVHKIRRANVTCRDVPLPPIDERKMLELEEKNHQNNLDVGAPPVKFRELYKKILYERSEKEAAMAEEEKPQTNPGMHWRRKMKLGINWFKRRMTQI